MKKEKEQEEIKSKWTFLLELTEENLVLNHYAC